MSEFEQLMEEIRKLREEARKSRKELKQKLADLQTEVTSSQEKASQELAHKISKSSYQFQRKGNEKQFNFNNGVQESIMTAKSELAKLTPVGDKDKEVLKKATELLDEGAKALATRQKHIQLADRSEFGWSTVRYYETNPLASDSDDEKSIKMAEKEAQREAEKKTAARKKKGASNRGYRPRHLSRYPSDQPGPSYRRDAGQPPAVPIPQSRPRVLGPCFRCGAFGHLAATCSSKEKLYPFCQPVVSSAEPVHEWFDSKTSVNKVADMSAEYQESVDGSMIRSSNLVTCKGQPVTSDGLAVNGSSSGELESVMKGMNTTSDLDPGDITKFWEIESSNPDQITDVQGRLTLHIAF